MLPQDFIDRMKTMLGEEAEEFFESFSQDKYQGLRLNPLKFKGVQLCGGQTGEAHLEQDLQPSSLPFHLTRIPWAKNGYYYEKEDQPGKHPYHEAGVYYIQEPSAMAPAGFLGVKPGQRVLDLCAAPGGKSTQLAGFLQGKGLLVCNEIHPARAKILSENIERLGVRNACVTNETPQNLAKIFPGYFDCILVDAPCSGEGMFRKNEDACGEWSLENVKLCGARQDEILDCAAGMLRPGGRLVYSTCTFAPIENEGSICRFLERDQDFSVLPIDKSNFFIQAGDDIMGAHACDGRNEWSFGVNEGELSRQDSLKKQLDAEKRSHHLEDTLRLWPHHIMGEGHYAALLQKAGEVPEYYESSAASGLAKGISEKELGEWPLFFKENLQKDSSFAEAAAAGKYMKFGDNLYLVPKELPGLTGMKVLRPGLHLGTFKKNRFEPSHALALTLSPEDVVHVWDLKSEEPIVGGYLNGQTFSAEGEKGWYLICVDGFSLGWGKLAGSIMKNHYPKGLRKP